MKRPFTELNWDSKTLKYVEDLEYEKSELESKKFELEKLLKATRNILQKCEDSSIILDVLEVTDFWDGAECDGYCLLEEIRDLDL